MRNLLTFVLLWCTILSAYAQDVQIKGVVISGEDNLPLPGVNVVVKGTTIGTTTDFDGQFSFAALVNTVRNRAKLADLPATTVSSKEKMADAVLNERRLELAYEGQRWFDLVRTGKVFSILNSLNTRDSGRLPMTPVTEETVLLPVPQTQIDKNPNLTQNKGY